MKEQIMVFLAIAVGIGFLVLLVLSSYLERRRVHPYVEIDPEKPSSDAPPVDHLSPYVQHMCDGAMAAGFLYGGFYAHAKYPKVTIAGTVWISNDRRILLNTGSGSVFGMAAKQTWLMTPRRDGTWIVTTDQNDEGDPSGTEEVKRVLNCTFQKLLQVHASRVNGDVIAKQFPTGRPFDLLDQRSADKATSMVQSGIARWRDTDCTMWSYSLASSLLAIWRFFKQFGGATLQIWRVNRLPVATPELSISAGPLIAKYRIKCNRDTDSQPDSDSEPATARDL